MRYGRILVILALVAPGLAACATPQPITVVGIATPSLKYRNAMAIRSVAGGQHMNILTMVGVANEPFQAALETTLAANGFLAQSGPPKFQVDAEIKHLEQPLIGLDMDVVAEVTYNVAGAGGAATYPVRSKGSATFSDLPAGAERLRIANERAMHENIKQFLQGLR